MKLSKDHLDTLDALSIIVLFPAFCFAVVYGCLFLTPFLINLIK
jgi:hypothetical protein